MWSRQLTFSTATRNMRVYKPSSDFCSEAFIAQHSFPYRSIASTVAGKNLSLSSLEILDHQTILYLLADSKFYAKVDKDLTLANQQIVKDTVNKLISPEKKLPSTARNLLVTTPKTSTSYHKPKIQKPNNPGRPIISACMQLLNRTYL